VLFIATLASGALVTWRVSIEAVAIAGGLVLLIASIRDLSAFHQTDTPAEIRSSATARSAAVDTSWLGPPVLSPLAIPAIVPPIGVVVILFFAGTAVGDPELQARLVSLVLAIMAFDFVAMICAGPIMRLVGMPVLQVVGWVFSAVPAGLAIQIILNSVRALQCASSRAAERLFSVSDTAAVEATERTGFVSSIDAFSELDAAHPRSL
jgi:multiple antibiotic resistance protein